jgi:hypothetical protein
MREEGAREERMREEGAREDKELGKSKAVGAK